MFLDPKFYVESKNNIQKVIRSLFHVENTLLCSKTPISSLLPWDFMMYLVNDHMFWIPNQNFHAAA